MQEPVTESQPPTAAGETDRREATPSVEEAEHALRSRVLGRVIAGAVHDIRTPLGTMVMKLQLVRDVAQDSDAAQLLAGHLRVLDAQVERVSELLRKLASAVEPAAPLGWVDLGALLADVAGALAYEARRRNVDVALEARTGVVRTGAEPETVARLVLCLFGWALAGTPAGGRLAARTVAREGDALLEIERTPGDPDGDVGYDWSVLAASAAVLGGRLERGPGDQGLERLALAIPRGSAAGEGQP